MHPTTLPRSFLYVPGTRPELFAKASAGPADAVVLDLEDSVPVALKVQARAHVRSRLTEDPEIASTTQQWVRINAESVAEDLEAVTHPALDGVFLAKCSVRALDQASRALDDLETGRGLGPGSVGVVGLVESADALLSLAEMARNPRLRTFGIGEVDLLGDLRMSRTDRSAAAVDMLRSQIVVHCAAAGLQAPVAPTSTAFRDLEMFRVSTHRLLDLGFRSRTAIHPSQVPVIHDVLMPDAVAIAAARDVTERFAAAAGGVTTDAHGRLIDAAVVREAHETLSRCVDR